jgi:hypothetical protein
MNFLDYKIRTGTETRVVQMTTGLLLNLTVNDYDVCTAQGYNDNGEWTSTVITEDNYNVYPYVSDYVRFPENRALAQIFTEEIERLRNNLRSV